MKLIITDIDDGLSQTMAAQYALTLGRPEGKPAFHLIERGKSLYAVVWNKVSLTVYKQPKRS